MSLKEFQVSLTLKIRIKSKRDMITDFILTKLELTFIDVIYEHFALLCKINVPSTRSSNNKSWNITRFNSYLIIIFFSQLWGQSRSMAIERWYFPNCYWSAKIPLKRHCATKQTCKNCRNNMGYRPRWSLIKQ